MRRRRSNSAPVAGGASVPMLNSLVAPALPMMTSPPWVQTIIGSMTFTASFGAATWPALAIEGGVARQDVVKDRGFAQCRVGDAGSVKQGNRCGHLVRRQGGEAGLLQRATGAAKTAGCFAGSVIEE